MKYTYSKEELIGEKKLRDYKKEVTELKEKEEGLSSLTDKELERLLEELED